MKRTKRIVSLVLILCLVAFGAAYATGDTAKTDYSGDTSHALSVAAKNANSVVGVITSSETWNRSTRRTEVTPIGEGSGVVIAEGGYILTNYHVIESGTTFQVLMPNGEKVDADVVGEDSSTDMAVLKVRTGAEQLVPVELGTSSDIPVGATAIAIGNPGGEILAYSVTQGIVSALERSVSARNASRRIDYIQHSAPISSGNSGGGLFNYMGQLIGINTLKYTGSAYSGASYEGLGFAIPVETAASVASDLIEFGKVQRPALGVTVSNWTDAPEEPMNDYPPLSICVQSVNQGGAADKAGMWQYDFIYAVNGERVTSLTELTTQLDMHQIGDTVTVTVVRYNNVSMVPTQQYSNFYGYSGSVGETLTVSGGFEMIDLQVQLELIAG